MDINIDFACRACLKETFSGVSINKLLDDYEMNLGEILTACTGLDLKTSNFPDKMCKSCSAELPKVWKFIKMCRTSNEMLQKYQDERKNGLENEKLSDDLKYEIKVEYNPPSVESHFLPDNFDDDDIEIKEESDKEKLHVFGSNESNNYKSVKKSSKTKKKKSKDYKNVMECPACGLNFETECRLKKHMKCKHPDDFAKLRYTCEECKKEFKRKSDLVVHNRIHSGEKPFACKYCPQRFTQSGTLIEHSRGHTGETPFRCKICFRVFKARSSFWRHRLVHTGEKPYACEQCGRMFAHAATLKHHQVVHTQERPHKCNICGKTSKSKYALQSHMVSHLEKHFICEQCGTKFTMKYNLENHIRKMHSSNAGQCCICKKMTSNLTEHMNLHTGETPFQCNICDRTFKLKNSLSFHLRMHKNAEKYKCQVRGCVKAFPKQNMLDFHIRKIHLNETPHICQHCSKGFFRASDLSRHINTLHPDNE